MSIETIRADDRHRWVRPAFATGVLLLMVLACTAIASAKTTPDTPGPSATTLAAALQPWASGVEASDRRRAPVTGSAGQYVATMRADGREVGLFVLLQSWPFATAPVFWINLAGDPPGQLVLTPTEKDKTLFADTLPPDWIASDYMRSRKPTRPLSFLALNPRRTTERAADGRRFSAKTPFITDHPVSPNLLARTTWWVDPPGKHLHALSVMVHHTADVSEATMLAEAIERRFSAP